MAPVLHLWLPILLSAVFVFVASSLIHMALKWHNPEYRGLPNEDQVREAINAGNPAPGQYVVPYCMDHKDMGKEEMVKKYKEGPVALVWLKAAGPVEMGGTLAGWFLFTLGVGFFVAYLAGHAMPPGTHYLKVFRVVGTAALLAYAAGSVSNSIWMGKPWSSTIKDFLDALIYALLTAGTFGWLWPK